VYSQTDEKKKDTIIMNEPSMSSVGGAYKCDSKVIDFINDLKRAIQTGEFQQQLKSDELNNQDQQQNSLSVISNLINVDNLSNQTFSYIVNWLKEQQPSPSPQTSLSQQQNQIDDEHNKVIFEVLFELNRIMVSYSRYLGFFHFVC